MMFGFIAKHRTNLAGGMAMRRAGGGRSGFHAWLNRSPSARSRSDEALGAQVTRLRS